MPKWEVVIRPERLKVLETENRTFRSSYDFNLNAQDLEQAHSELGETEDLMNDCLDKLKEMLLRDQKFRYRTDDKYLLRFLRYAKYDCKKAQGAVRNLYKFRSSRPDVFSVPSDIEKRLNLGIIKYLPYRDGEGSIIMWLDTRKWDLKEITLFDILQAGNAVADVVSTNPGCQVNSLICLNDMAGVTASHLAQYLYPSFLSVLLKCLQDCYPLRIKRVFGINCNPAIRAAYYVVSLMLKKKIADRAKMQKWEIVIRPERLKVLETENMTFRSSYDFNLNTQDLEQAHSELGETEDLMNDCLENLKDMLLRDQNMLYRTDDKYLLRYLRYKKYECKNAYNVIKNLYKLRTNRPDIFSVPSDIETMLNIGVVKYLPYRDGEGSIIFWIDSKKWDLKEISLFNLLQVANAVSDLISMNPSCQVNSVIGVFDLGGVTASHLAQYLYPSILSVLLKCLQDCYPWRIKRIFGINCNKAIRTAYYVVSLMIKKKIADRIVLLGSDFTELHRYLSPSLLPKEYGGSIEENECSLNQLVLDNLEYLEYERSFGPK